MPNFVVSGLPAYVQDNRDLLLKNFGLVGTATRQRIAIQTGIKKSAYINFLDIEPVFQSGEGCGFSASGTATLSQRTINVARIKVNLDICPDTLVGKYAEYLVRINANPGALPFEQYVIDGLVAEINKGIEKLIWQGDTTSLDPILKWTDGFLKQMVTEYASLGHYDASFAGTVYEGVLAAYMNAPEEILERGAIIFVSPADFRALTQELVAKNLYHFAPANENAEEIILPGTDARVVKTPGLAGVHKIVCTFGDNLVYGTDMEGDWEDIKVWFSDDADLYKLAAKWATGVAYKFPEYISFVGFASTPAAYVANDAALAKLASAVNSSDQIETHPNS